MENRKPLGAAWALGGRWGISVPGMPGLAVQPPRASMAAGVRGEEQPQPHLGMAAPWAASSFQDKSREGLAVYPVPGEGSGTS